MRKGRHKNMFHPALNNKLQRNSLIYIASIKGLNQ